VTRLLKPTEHCEPPPTRLDVNRAELLESARPRPLPSNIRIRTPV